MHRKPNDSLTMLAGLSLSNHSSAWTQLVAVRNQLMTQISFVSFIQLKQLQSPCRGMHITQIALHVPPCRVIYF